jgi:hypothetical protein
MMHSYNYRTTSTKPTSKDLKHEPKGGFALVIALSLMAFILLLLLSITTFVQVESSNAANSTQRLEARTNAQLGAMIALGNLQKLTGPDQRVTARADILVEPDSTPLEGTAHWTGVWSSKLDSNRDPLNDTLDQDTELDAHKPQWLVSGTPTDLANYIDPITKEITASPNADPVKAVMLVNRDASVNSNAQEVVVLKETVDQNAGAFAYWVSDEGIKARINLESPFVENTTTTDADYYNFALAQLAEPTLARDSDGNQPYFIAGASSWKTANTQVDSVITPEMLPLIGAVGDANEVYRGFFHDFTTNSQSVLANVRDGGLKQDLSIALLNPSANGLTGSLFPSAVESPGVGDPGGPRWAQMSDHYIETIRNDPSAASIQFRAHTVSDSRDKISITPVVTRFHMIVQVFAERVGWYVDPPLGSPIHPDNGGSTSPNFRWPEAAENYEYRVGLFPMITLWNPYDKPMTFDTDLGMETDFGGVALVRNEENRGQAKTPMPTSSNAVNEGDTGIIRLILDEANLTNNSDSFGARRRKVSFTLKTQGLTIPAGRAVNFSPPLNSEIDLQDATRNVMVPGASEEYINGFFTAGKTIVDRSLLTRADYPAPRKPYTDAGWHEFFPLNADGGRSDYSKGASKLSFMSQRSIGNHEVRLYKEPFSGKPDPENRFYNLTIDDVYFGRYYTGQDNSSPRVMRLWEATESQSPQISNFDFVEGQAASVGASFDNLVSPISILDVYNHVHPDRNLNAIARYMAMPDLNQRYGQGESIHLMSQFNPRAPLVRSDAHVRAQNKISIGGLSMYPFMYEFTQPPQATRWTNPSQRPIDLTEYYTVGIDFDDNRYSHVGMGIKDDLGSGQENKRMILFESPTRPPLGIGQFMHANLMSVGYVGSGFSWGPFGSNLQQPVASPAYAIGNSFASVHLPLDETRVAITPDSPMFTPGFSFNDDLFRGTYTGAHYDYSYELNDALWDDFYLSTLLPDTSSATVDFPADGVLPNARIKLWNAEPDDADLIDSTKSAAKLVLDGGFNINSTSIAAWEAVLSALRDVTTLGEEPSDNNLRHSFARFTEPLEGPTGDTPSYNQSDELASAYRSLTDNQINLLAESIVREIRTRRSANGHPFLSLADFINRSINSEDIEDRDRQRFAYNGALQFAIDQSTANGQPALDNNGMPQSGGSGIWEDPYIGAIPSDQGPYLSESLKVIENRGLFEAAPGALTQADVLSKIGSMLVPRSDTFTIRSYGEASDSISGNVNAKAYLELTVQRTPAYVANSDGSAASGDEAFAIPSDPINQRFGRKFKIISSRWINENEI